MPESAVTIAVDMQLQYRHPLGALSPYFRALQEGRALASRWRGRTYFPPRLPPDGRPPEWVELTGLGTVIAITRAHGLPGPTGEAATTSACVLVAMDGAGNMVVGRVHDSRSLQPGCRLQLSVAENLTPAFPLSLGFKRFA